MRLYHSSDFFPQPDFPLTLELASQRSSMIPHGHDFIELVLVSRGCSVQRITYANGCTERYGIIRGDVFSVFPGEVHSYENSRHFEIYNLAFQPSVLANEWPELMQIPSCRALLEATSPRHGWHLYLDAIRRQEAITSLQRMLGYVNLRQVGDRLRLKTAFLDFLLSLGNREVRQARTSLATVQTPFLASLERLEQDVSQKTTLAELAHSAHKSISSYIRQFEQVIGLPPMDYRTLLRLNQARRLMRETQMSLSQIADACGFYDCNYMIKLFRSKYGMTPGRWRRSLDERG